MINELDVVNDVVLNCWNSYFDRCDGRMSVDMAIRKSKLDSEVIRALAVLAGFKITYSNNKGYIIGWAPKGYINKIIKENDVSFDDVESDLPFKGVDEETQKIVKNSKRRKNVKYVV